MARKGKEPAGLRRWRLAQKRKTAGRKVRRSAPKRTVRHMARRRYSAKRRGHRKSKSIPVAASVGTAMFLGECYSFIKSHPELTLQQKLINVPLFKGIGYDPASGTWDTREAKGGMMLGAGLLASAVLPKIPLVRSVPKRIPLVGKYLRW